MPVTAKLSQGFYERLGNELANELVEWFNSVDATYRSDLRELNELNFARFDAKLEQRLAQLEARLETRFEQRVYQLESRVDQRITQLESRLDQRITQLDAKVDSRFASLEGGVLGRIETRLAEVRTQMLRWMLAGWVTIMALLLGTVFAVLQTR